MLQIGHRCNGIYLKEAETMSYYLLMINMHESKTISKPVTYL